MKHTKEAIMLAAMTTNAYSADRYKSWVDVAQVLLNKGFSSHEAEAIMRSKWTRWAADQSDAKHGKVPAKALTDWMTQGKIKRKDVIDLLNETTQG